MGVGCHVMTGASIAGRVIIGDYVSIGTNATILPNIKITKIEKTPDFIQSFKSGIIESSFSIFFISQ